MHESSHESPHELKVGVRVVHKKKVHLDEKHFEEEKVVKKKSFMHRIFKKDHTHDPEFRRGIEPLPEVNDVPSEKHFARKGMEPLHELHPTHPGVLHRDMEIYELERELKKIEAKAKKR